MCVRNVIENIQQGIWSQLRTNNGHSYYSYQPCAIKLDYWVASKIDAALCTNLFLWVDMCSLFENTGESSVFTI